MWSCTQVSNVRTERSPDRNRRTQVTPQAGEHTHFKTAREFRWEEVRSRARNQPLPLVYNQLGREIGTVVRRTAGRAAGKMGNTEGRVDGKNCLRSQEREQCEPSICVAASSHESVEIRRTRVEELRQSDWQNRQARGLRKKTA